MDVAKRIYTKEEIKKIAPGFKGKVENFDLARAGKKRLTTPQTEGAKSVLETASTTCDLKARRNIPVGERCRKIPKPTNLQTEVVERARISIDRAPIVIFLATAPRLTYETQSSYYEDLENWLIHMIAILESIPSNCCERCCCCIRAIELIPYALYERLATRFPQLKGKSFPKLEVIALAEKLESTNLRDVYCNVLTEAKFVTEMEQISSIETTLQIDEEKEEEKTGYMSWIAEIEAIEQENDAICSTESELDGQTTVNVEEFTDFKVCVKASNHTSNTMSPQTGKSSYSGLTAPDVNELENLLEETTNVDVKIKVQCGNRLYGEIFHCIEYSTIRVRYPHDNADYTSNASYINSVFLTKGKILRHRWLRSNYESNKENINPGKKRKYKRRE